jgi:hypothetical protein
LHPELVFFGRYWSVFLGMYDAITEGNLGQCVNVRNFNLYCAIKTRPTRAEKQHDTTQIGSGNKNPARKGEMKPSWRSITEPLQRGHACDHTSSVRARALSSQGKMKKHLFSRASKQNKQNIRIRCVQCFPPLSA